MPGQEADTCSTHAPMRRAMSLIGDMWTLMIVYNLLSGPRRFGELREAMGNVSPKTVSQRLKMLEEDGFGSPRFCGDSAACRIPVDAKGSGPG